MLLVANPRQLQIACRCSVLPVRVLSTDYHRLASNLVELTGLLQPLGLNPGDVRKLVLKHPNMLLASPITTAQKLQSVRVSFDAQ